MVKNGCCKYTKVQEECYLKHNTKTNHQTVKGDWDSDKNKQEYAKPVIAGKGRSIHKGTSENFSGIYRQIKSQKAGETDPLKYLVRLEREKLSFI